MVVERKRTDSTNCPPTGPTISLPLVRYVAEIGGLSRKSIIDSGATTLYIGRKLVKELGLKTAKSTQKGSRLLQRQLHHRRDDFHREAHGLRLSSQRYRLCL